MQQWEHEIHKCNIVKQRQVLQEREEAGWEMCGVLPDFHNDDAITFYFKRPKLK